MIDIKTNRLLFASVLGGALAVVHWTGMLDSAIQPAHSERATATPEQVAADKLSSQLREWRGLLESRRFNSGTTGDAFSGMSWAPPPPAPVAAGPRVPLVPPFQYTFMGTLTPEGSGTILFLTRGDTLYTLNEGDLIEGVFRIEAIKDNHLEVVHVATQTRLTRSFDELANPASAAQASVTPGSSMTIAHAPSQPVGNTSALGLDEQRVAEERADSNSAVMSIVGSGPAVTPNQPPAATASTPMTPSPPGSPMQMLPPGKPMEMTIPTANTVPPQGLSPVYPANVVPPQGAGK